MDKTVVGVKRDEKREVELFGEPRDQGFVKGGRDLDLERIFKRSVERGTSDEQGSPSSVLRRSLACEKINVRDKGSKYSGVRTLSKTRNDTDRSPRATSQVTSEQTLLGTWTVLSAASLSTALTHHDGVLVADPTKIITPTLGSTSSTSVPCFTDQDRASDPSRRMTRIVGLLQQAKDVLNGNKAGHNFATFKKNARQAFPSITLPKSNRRSDGFVPRALKGTLGPAFENKRRLRWGRVSLIEGTEVVVDETGKTTIGEVVSAVLPLLNESCLLQDIEHDIAIQMSHGSIPLTRRETARSDSREFEVRGELVDGPVLLKSYTKLVVHNAIETSATDQSSSTPWLATKKRDSIKPKPTDTSSKSSAGLATSELADDDEYHKVVIIIDQWVDTHKPRWSKASVSCISGNDQAYSEPSYQPFVSANWMLQTGAKLTDSDVKGVLCRLHI
ncbi:uncharacterized protein F5891DRAFT_984887 [Suillus fuscotomentosus]|uniref:Uncharacterized protein n=1 Tax=Suillus fuscotomentosus TaxID=1912939 RepID=A0AAD4DVA9_9AGAM|nr:uncharacterized protein F5891DRAFT_984887 [Suillus fuscotomentosus]KAG1894610.1 hypothetical protein F5891DRAFT_984887 [Suillus fuscotomentosus]